MNVRKAKRPAVLLVFGALLVCLLMTGCEDWFRSETVTLQTPETVTTEPTEQHEATVTQAPPTSEPSTPAPPSEDDYPYPVDMPEEPGDLPQYPEDYPSD